MNGPVAAENWMTVLYTSPLVEVQRDPSGRYTARLVGLPDLQATAASRDEALLAVRQALLSCLTSGTLVPLHIPAASLFPAFHHTDPDDTLEKEYLQELERQRREDLERTLHEYDEEDRADRHH
jgi:hypothetical protein